MPTSVIIDQLWGGVSGQAVWSRKSGTVAAAKNLRFDLRVGGAVKRNPFEFVSALVADTTTDMIQSELFYWSHIRGAIIAIARGNAISSLQSSILGWDKNGVPLEVIDKTAGGFATYMESATDILRDIDVASKRATLIICNRNQDMGDVLKDAWNYEESFQYLRAGDEFDSGTPNASSVDSTQGEKTFFRELEDVASPTAGDVWEIISDENLDPAGFYMFFGTDSIPRHAGYERGYFPRHGEWHRVPRANDAEGRYDETLMPHRLVYDEDAGTLTIDTIRWRQRISGNQHTVAAMPWADEGITSGDRFKIMAVEFYSGRLFLISQEHVTGSRNGDFFNLWIDSAAAPADKDRISENVTQSAFGDVLRCKQVGEALLLLAEQGQLEFSPSSEVLTNTNGRIVSLTDFPSQDIDPAAGPGLVTFMDDYGDVHQFTWGSIEPKALIYTGLLTAHVPKHFHGKTPERIHTYGNTIWILLKGDNPEVHDTFFVRGAAIQSAWCEYETTEDIVYVHAWEGVVRIVTHKIDTDEDYTLMTYLHREQVAPEGMDYIPRMDRLELIPLSDITYDSEADETTIPHTGRDGDLQATQVVTTNPDNKHEFVKPTRLDDNGDPVFAGDLADADSTGLGTVAEYIGFVWETLLTLNELYPDKTANDVQTDSLTIFHYETTDYKVVWDPFPGAVPQPSVLFQSHRVGLTNIGEAKRETKFLTISMDMDPRVGVVTISSDTPGQFSIMALEYSFEIQGRGIG